MTYIPLPTAIAVKTSHLCVIVVAAKRSTYTFFFFGGVTVV